VIGLFAVTAAGRAGAAELARALGPDAVVVDGPLRPGLERLWPELDAAVLFLATGATVRLIAPLLVDKNVDPGVVCVDEAHRFAIALAGGHDRAGGGGGANALAEQVARVLGATAVVSTASDSAGSTPLDELVALVDAAVDGDLAAAGVALLDGEPVLLVNPLGFPLPALPPNVSLDVGEPGWRIVIDDRLPAVPDDERTLRLVPPTLSVGIGSVRDVSADAVAAVLDEIVGAGLDPRAVRRYASIDLKGDERGILDAVAQHGFFHGSDPAVAPVLRTFTAEQLRAVVVPNPSAVVQAEVGTPSVSEASALLAAAEHGRAELVLAKVKGAGPGAGATVAVARSRPRGRLAVVGLGPGAADLRTPRAEAELRRASVVVGLDQYVDQVRHLLRAGTEIAETGLGQESERAAAAVALARAGRAVALIGSGDAGVYAMASPALEQAGDDIDVVGVPGVTAALAASAVLGAPLGHDHVLISLSDLHTPWPAILRRVRAAAEGDFVVCFYNPRSRERDWQLGVALDVLREHRPAGTPVGAVRQISRDGERAWTAPIGEFDPATVDMLTTVVVGSSTTTMVGGRMVTPRGYAWMPG
jgi:cobalt-precorrin 5A hydrolase/precorrin-3B C17-methyltransferase